jgi:hypothetical protein
MSQKAAVVRRCSFCGCTEEYLKSRKDGLSIIDGPSFTVCVECLDLCNELMDQKLPEAPSKERILFSDKIRDEHLYDLTSAVLDALALSGVPQPYGVIAPIVGYHHRSRLFYLQLGRSLREDYAAGKPLRASLVINKALGMPGKAYYEVCRELGYDIPPDKEWEFWKKQIASILSGVPVPHPVQHACTADDLLRELGVDEAVS